ncbi:MAG: glycosyl hydrolase 115 family protein [Bacteroidota bacterium]
MRLMLGVLIFFSLHLAMAIGGDSFVSFTSGKEKFALSASGSSAPICISSREYSGVRLIVGKFQADVESVTGAKPVLSTDRIPRSKEIVIIGTIGRSQFLRTLIDKKKLDVKGIEGEWESFLIQSVEKPFPGVDRALVIAGSDKRGTMYAVFDLSQRMGVSPWYWWADVPIKHHPDVFIDPGRHSNGPPSVKYRGIFLNDEAPDLTNWIRAKFGMVPVGQDPPIPPGVANYGRQFYEKLFELILRLKGNYLWPAMWNNAFNEDDLENPRLADEYGIVMGTSHQEPMLRAQKEWDRRYKQTLGSWNYAKYPDTLQKFWREGVKRNKNYESIITIGLRGADDTPMAEGGPEENMALLEKIVGVQRRILAAEVNPDVRKIPQMWCLYKEVLDFYNAGMRVPDDVTLLWPDDNWGNNRRLPTLEERTRSGGAGIYYHFDYHGGPRSYQWLNTNPIPKIWEQMSLAKEYGADRIWIVNVGHFKGYEFPLEYFMDLAWDTKRWAGDNTDEYTRRWVAREFGEEYADGIAAVIAQYTKFNGRRKPELLSPTTYSLVNYHEAENVVAEFDSITAQAEEISRKLPAEAHDAFYQLVLFPAKASALVSDLYVSAGKNALYAQQGRVSTNAMAERTRSLFEQDTSLMGYFNRTFANGKWDHFMDQTHLGYTNWQDPPTNSLRAISLTDIAVPDSSSMGVAVEGSVNVDANPVLPRFDVFNRQRHWIEIFNRGKLPFVFSAQPDQPWINLSSSAGEIKDQLRIWVSVDWKTVPQGSTGGTVKVTGAGGDFRVNVEAFSPEQISRASLEGFVEGEGFVSIEAEHYTNKIDHGPNRWMKIEDYGHTLSAMRTTSEVNAPELTPGRGSPCLEYRMYLFSTGKVEVKGIFGVALNFMPNRAVRYGVSFDDEAPQIVTLVPGNYRAQNGNRDWENAVANNGRTPTTTHAIGFPGYHTLKIWMVDPAVALEKIVVDLGGVKPSYLGPPESFRASGKK